MQCVPQPLVEQQHNSVRHGNNQSTHPGSCSTPAAVSASKSDLLQHLRSGLLPPDLICPPSSFYLLFQQHQQSISRAASVKASVCHAAPPFCFDTHQRPPPAHHHHPLITRSSQRLARQVIHKNMQQGVPTCWPSAAYAEGILRLTHSLPHCLTHCLTASLTASLPHSLPHCFTRCLTHRCCPANH